MIFYTQFKTPIKKTTLQHYWTDRLEKLGLIKRRKGRGHRYGKNLHELRDVFRSQWEKSPAKGSVAEYFMGHKVDPLEYNKAHKDDKWVKQEYRKALPFLSVMSSGRPFGLIEEDSVDNMRSQLDAATREIEELKDDNQSMFRALPDLIQEMKELRIQYERQADKISLLESEGNGRE